MDVVKCKSKGLERRQQGNEEKNRENGKERIKKREAIDRSLLLVGYALPEHNLFENTLTALDGGNNQSAFECRQHALQYNPWVISAMVCIIVAG